MSTTGSAIHIATGQYVFRNVGTGTYLNEFNYETALGSPIVMQALGGVLTNDRWNLLLNMSVQEGYTYTYTLQSVATLALANPSGTNVVAGTNLVTGNNINVQWILTPGAEPYSYCIQLVGTDLALEPLGDSVDNATQVVLNTLTSSAGQSWFIIAADYAEASNKHI